MAQRYDDDAYSIDEENQYGSGSSSSRIPRMGERTMSLRGDDVLEISSSSEDYSRQDSGRKQDEEERSGFTPDVIPVVQSARSSVADYAMNEMATESRFSLPEATSASRLSATGDNSHIDVEEGHTSRVSFETTTSIISENEDIDHSEPGLPDGRMMSTDENIGDPLDDPLAEDTAENTYDNAEAAPRNSGNFSTARTAGVSAPQRKVTPGLKRAPIKPVAVLSPARIIAEFKRGSMNKQQAVESLIRYRMNKMLHKNSDRMYVDKDGDVRFVKGYDFGKSRDARGRSIKRNGFTRIEREILAYQKSTHLLIPRTIFARIVREIAQHWWKGPGPVKFTVEALTALQAATEDEITRLLEISTACSYHAKRITLRIDDMRLARFCRGRQEYEFFNIKS